MKRRFLLFLLAACLGLTACQGQGIPAAPGPDSAGEPTLPPAETGETAQPGTQEPTPLLPVIPAEEAMGFTDLDSRLIAYLQETGLAEESFTVSPLSYKAALALAALGAEGETLDQLLSAMGFASLEELQAWYASVLVGVADFDGRIMGRDKADCAYRVVNAIFHNADCDGEFREAYKELVAQKLAAQTGSHSAAELTEAVNKWVNDQTNGLIPSIVNDVSESAAVLVNALYLKTKWLEPFQESEHRDFTTVTGETVQKQFMAKTEKFRYYADDGCQMVVIPLQGGVSMALILGDAGGLSAKLSQAKPRKVAVTMPKFEVETSLDEKQLVNFLKSVGCTRMFVDGAAEFDPMFTEGVYVDDIIQKAKVKVDEKGLEAAAATAVVMMRNTALPNPEEPVVFMADHPFRFAVYREDETPELLFWGQVTN